MKNFALMAAALVLGFTLSIGDAEAKRLGGGSSSGMQRQSVSPSAPPSAAKQAPTAAPAAAPAAQPKRSWMGPLAGLAAGLGLAALASHFGFGEGLANMMMIGLLIMLIWGAADLGKKNAAMRVSLVLLGVALILGAFFETRQQLKHWRSSRLLFEHTLAVTGPNAVVYSNLAHALFEEGDWKGAEENYRNAIRCDPKYANAHANLGAVLDRQGRTDEALEEYRKGLALNPGHADAHYHLGLMMERQGNFLDADRHYGEAQNSDPAHIQAVRQRGALAMKLGNYAKAAEYFRMALQNNPGNPGLKDALSQAVERRDATPKTLD